MIGSVTFRVPSQNSPMRPESDRGGTPATEQLSQLRRWAIAARRSARGSALAQSRGDAHWARSHVMPWSSCRRRLLRAARQQARDGCLADLELLRDLGARAPLEPVEEERHPLTARDALQRGDDLVGAHAVVLLRGRRNLVQRDLLRSAQRLAVPLVADVPRDRDQPRPRFPRRIFGERFVGVQERGLGDVFCVGRIADERERVAVDVGDMPAIERVEVVVGPLPGRIVHA